MATKTFDVEVHGLDVLRAKLDQRRLFGPVKEEMIARAAQAGKKEAEEKSKGQFGKKGLRGRIETHFEQDGLIARVSPIRSLAGIAFTMEHGRRPGKRPPYKRIKAWATGNISTPVRELQEDIKLHGTGGLFFMAEAAQVANDTLRDRRPVAEREIERGWNG